VLGERFGAGAFTVVRSEAVGPKVGSELRRQAAVALLIAFALTLVYLAWRFEWRFGLAAVLATIHDIVGTLAFMKYMNIEISLFVVGAILTVVGYSMNDTVVVFDRVRENLRSDRRSTLRDLLNRSVNETLPRTVMTGTTTLASLLALLIFGGAVIRPFAWVLSFGIIIGTFSSIYVASPLLLLIEQKWPRRAGEATPKGKPRVAREDPSRVRPKEPAGAR
jgi:preprotein translocase subunit SecF